MSIDFPYIRSVLERFEGKGIAKGYVPSKNGVALGVSGVTIGTGVDLGQQTGAGLMDMGVPHAVVKKLLPYIGLKKAAAQEALRQQPLTLTAEEVAALDDAVIRRYVRDIEARYNKNFPHLPFADIPREAQAVVVSILYQRGLGSCAKFPRTWEAMLRGDWADAARRLGDASLWDGYQTRRRAEGEILKQIAVVPKGADSNFKK